MNKISFKCGLFEFSLEVGRIELGLIIMSGFLGAALYIEKVMA